MRNLSTEMQAVSTAEVVRPIMFVECEFDSGDINLWNGVGSLAYSGKNYIGAGNLLAVEPVSESTDLRANGTSVTLSGLNNTLVGLAKDEDYQGRALTVKLGAMDESNDVIADPVIMFSGFMDTMMLTDSGESSTITIDVENKLIQMDRARVRRFTDNDQRIDYPNDDGFSFVTKIQDREINWGVPFPNAERTGGTTGTISRDDRSMK
jgi:hypothetical protein